MKTGNQIGGIEKLLLLVVSVLLLVAGADARTTISPEDMEVGGEGGSYRILVDGDGGWTVTTEAAWLALLPDNREGTGEVAVTVAPNTTGIERSVILSIDGQIHKVRQHAGAAGETFGVTMPLLQHGPHHGLAGTTFADALPAVSSQAAVSTAYGDVFRADRGFSVRVESSGGVIRAVAATSDGGFVVVGRFSTIAGQPHLNIARYRADGTVDPAFCASTGFDGEVRAVAVQPDGKIVVGGDFTTFDGAARSAIARLNADGTLDSSFNPGAGFNSTVRSVGVQSGGRVVVAGDFTAFDGASASQLVRLTTAGALDANFITGTGFGNSPDSQPVLRALAVLADGRIVVGGTFDSFNGVACKGIARLNVNGALDAIFNTGVGSGFSPATGGVHALVAQPDGWIVVGGRFASFNGTARNGIVRLRVDGTVDATFNPGTGFDGSQVESLARQADGRIVVGGIFTLFNGNPRGNIARLNTDGTLDATFDPGTGFEKTPGLASIVSLAVLTDGRIVAGGDFASLNGQAVRNLTRMTATGALDALAAGFLWKPGLTLASATVGEKILVAGIFSFVDGVRRTGIARINGDGTLDTTFALVGTGFDGDFVSRFVVQPDGKIVVIGSFSSYNGTARRGIARMNADGSLDPTFVLTGSGFDAGSFFSLVAQPDGKLVVTGDFFSYNGTPRNGIARLNSDGSLDTAFNPGGGFDSIVLTLAVQSDGKIVAGGVFSSFNGVVRAAIARLNANGSLDTTFNPGTGFTFDGILGNSGIVQALVLQPDGKIVVGGDYTTFNGVGRNRVARLNTNGTLDASFDPGSGFTGPVSALALQEDGEIVVGGSFATFDGIPHLRVARLKADGRADGNFSTSEVVGGGVVLADDGRVLVSGSGAIGPGVVQVGFAVLKPDAIAPVFTTQPASVTVNAGGSATFTATANGFPAPTYQWFKLPSTLLSGKTEATLTLANVQPSDAGLYVVGAVNSAGDAISNIAFLTVNGGSSSSSSGGGSSSSSSSSGSGYGGGDNGGGGYGGGGAPSLWFTWTVAVLLVGGGRRWMRRDVRLDRGRGQGASIISGSCSDAEISWHVAASASERKFTQTTRWCSQLQRWLRHVGFVSRHQASHLEN